MIKFIFIANVLDAFLTSYFVSLDEAVELNPFMSYLLENNIPTFFFVKISVVFLCLLFFNKHKEKLIVKYILSLCVFVYTMVLLIHIYGFFVIFLFV